MNYFYCRNAIIVLGMLLGVCAARPMHGQSIDYNRDVRPILAGKCFACHGRDNEHRQADLRLDEQQSALADRGGYAAIVPEHPLESALYQRVFSSDPEVQMPPADSGKHLSDKEIAVLRRWIEEGAEYQQHWAFLPPRRPQLPAIRTSAWPRNALDMFVLARLEQAQLAPSREADPSTLARRVSIDLIGLPPLPDDLDWFLADVRETSLDEAYERLVDRLLASPRYGERWARQWLDLAAYADTNGYEKDRTREIWAYRDWVVQSLNEDLPFDQFTVQQVAGDLLPNATLKQRIATGFYRNTMLNEEGGIDPLEYRFYAMRDRMAMTGTAWLGLTLQCCQCHSHKFDPISQREYYGLMALLNNADEPDMDLPRATLEDEQQRNLARADELLAALPKEWPLPDQSKSITASPDDGDTGDGVSASDARKTHLEQSFREWLDKQRRQAATWTPLRPEFAHSNMPILTVQEDDSVFVSGDITKHDIYQLRFKPRLTGVTAFRLEALPDDRLPGHGPGLTYYEGDKGDFFLGEFQILADDQPLKFARAAHSFAANQYGDGQYPVSAALAIDGNVQTGWSIYGRLGERHTAVFVLERPLEGAPSIELVMHFGRHFASSLGKFRISVTTAPSPEAVDLPEDVELLLTKSDLSEAELAMLRREFLLAAPELRSKADEIRRLRKPPSQATTLVLRERPPDNPRLTHLYTRGEFLRPAETVTAGIPTALLASAAEPVHNRLDFARWLVSPHNPLTARVVVNRQWAALFGKGIVGTLADFGLQGMAPSHPELLDWLAVEFVESGWSLKRLHKLIVTSATYRQSSRATPELVARDPANELLGRMSRRRLEAEMIGDAALQSAGLLSTKMFGPSVKPPQPAGVSEVAWGNPSWDASTGEDRYRRSLYTFVKRTAPFAAYQAFDAPSGENCVARRDVSNTPLQALTLLNDVMFTEAAQALGRRVAEIDGDDVLRVTEAFRRVLCRPPDGAEIKDLLHFVISVRQRIGAGELDASLLGGGDERNVAERAVWTALARALFSLDETITRN